MKYLLALLLFIFFNQMAVAQNSYPTSGNVKIFAVDGGWVEGISIVKASGWSGIRLTRDDPASGNFNGNWALGYNVNTGNDFSISTNYGGTQYDALFHISNSTRNIGIGTTTPGSKLQVVGSGGASIDLNVNGRIITGDGAGAGGIWIGSTGNMFVGQASGTKLGFYNNGNWRLITDSNGNVGIGTDTPTQKLTVNGTVYSKEVKVDVNAGADFVFEKSYTLPSLDQVKSYIDENRHLPEVPSAEEMEENGINLSEMNMLLLKKVEELTLYILKQEERIKAIEQKMK